jgi:hypothetical protein
MAQGLATAICELDTLVQAVTRASRASHPDGAGARKDTPMVLNRANMASAPDDADEANTTVHMHSIPGVDHPSDDVPADSTKTSTPTRAIRFPLADGFRPSFRSTSFPSGNRSPHADCPPQDYRVNHSQRAADDAPFLGGPVESPRPSDKERLARQRQVGLFDIRGLATPRYHGGDLGVRVLTVQFIHECGYRSFSNTMSPEDVLLSYGKIIQVYRKVEQSWFNTCTQTSGPSVERILERGLTVFPKLHKHSISRKRSTSTINYRSSPPLTSSHSCLLMPSALSSTSKAPLSQALALTGMRNVPRL